MVRKASALARTGSFAESHAALDQVLADFEGTENPRVRVQLGRALATRAALEVATGRPRDALATSERLEREFATLHDGALLWRTRCHSVRALLALSDLGNAHARFASAYQAFESNPQTIREMVLLASEALAAGFRATDLVDLLSADKDKANALTPLIIALRQESGEDARAAEEVLEVAADIRASWHKEAPSNSRFENERRP